MGFSIVGSVQGMSEHGWDTAVGVTAVGITTVGSEQEGWGSGVIS